MPRPREIEFSAKTKDQAAQRAGGKCEKCGIPFYGRRPEFDHILPAALGGKPELANCMVLCEPCHAEKTAKEDVPRIRKADRQRRAANGSRAPRKKIQSRPFPETEKTERRPKIDKSALPPLGQSAIARRYKCDE